MKKRIKFRITPKYSKIINKLNEMKTGDILSVECGDDTYTVYGYFQKYPIKGYKFSKNGKTVIITKQ